jgi:hypothetical protein
MEWAGGKDWGAFIESINLGGEESVKEELKKSGKDYPSDWVWEGEHWQIAK